MTKSVHEQDIRINPEGEGSERGEKPFKSNRIQMSGVQAGKLGGGEKYIHDQRNIREIFKM